MAALPKIELHSTPGNDTQAQNPLLLSQKLGRERGKEDNQFHYYYFTDDVQ